MLPNKRSGVYRVVDKNILPVEIGQELSNYEVVLKLGNKINEIIEQFNNVIDNKINEIIDTRFSELLLDAMYNAETETLEIVLEERSV